MPVRWLYQYRIRTKCCLNSLTPFNSLTPKKNLANFLLCNKMMEIKRTENGREGIFEAFDGQERMGYMSYTWDNDEQMAIEHTVVDPALLDEAVCYARQNHKKIRAVCSFVVAKFQKSSAYDDVKTEA